MSEKYSAEKAHAEAIKMQEVIKTGQAKNYDEAENLVTAKEENVEIKLTPEQKAAGEFIRGLAMGFIGSTSKFKDKFDLSGSLVQRAAKEEVINLLDGGQVNYVRNIINKISLPDSFVQQAVKEALIKNLARGWVGPALEIRNGFLKLSKDIIINSEVQALVKKAVFKSLKNGSVDYANEIKRSFYLPEEVLMSSEAHKAAEGGLISSLNQGDLDKALKIKEAFDLSEELIMGPEALQAAIVGLYRCLAEGWMERAIAIEYRFGLSEPIVQHAAKEGLFECFDKGRIYEGSEIKEKFKVKITLEDILERFPEAKEMLREVSKTAPAFIEQIKKSDDLSFAFLEIIDQWPDLPEILNKNPWLGESIAANSRFGPKLFVKFPQLDDVSKGNIQFQFLAKKEILAENFGFDSESLEFRQAMQEKLMNWKDNPKVLEAAQENNINTDAWLNYGETKYFRLASDENSLAFSENLRTPIARIRETINSYAYTIKDVLKEYRPELAAYQIVLEDVSVINEQKEKMLTALAVAQKEGNEKKAAGIQKGLDSLAQRGANLKKGALWDKLTGDIAAFQRLKDDVFTGQEKLVLVEEELRAKAAEKMPSGKEVQDLKRKLAGAREELRNKFALLETRIDNFKASLPDFLAPALGAERSGALVREIEQRLAEQFDHYQADRGTLANLFSERADKEKEQLESKPMSIFVWARNPDIDLYQGNYSPCCICIDSAHMGAESTIADYNTDLGIQIINIWDETKNEPVTAAWCWLGKNEKGETALVVDNIESNTMFSANYSEQLTRGLFEYFKDYAAAIGVKKVVMGKANNDLPSGGELSKMADDNGRYSKIGGYNRPDGYFLEAEDKSVKLIWQAGEQEAVRGAVEEPVAVEISKVQFEQISATRLNEKNLPDLLRAERIIYADTDLIQNQAMAEDIKQGNGFEYSVLTSGKREGNKVEEIVGYLVAVEDETDEGDKTVYLEDIAVLPEGQRQGIGWEMLKSLIIRLKSKAQSEGKSTLFDMHLREGSQALFDGHREDLERMGAALIEEALVPNYYEEGEDGLYRVYEIGA